MKLISGEFFDPDLASSSAKNPNDVSLSESDGSFVDDKKASNDTDSFGSDSPSIDEADDVVQKGDNVFNGGKDLTNDSSSQGLIL